MTFLTSVGTNVSGFKISDAPQEFIDTHFELKIFVKVEHKNRGKLYLAVLNIELMKMNRLFAFLFIMLAVLSCKEDDNGGILEAAPPRELAEVAVENDAEIIAFLETHFYNYEEFEAPPANFDFKIKVDTLEGDNANKTPLIDQVISSNVTVSSFEFGLDGEEEVQHTFYYLIAREGVGESPTIADSTFVRYRGSLLDGSVFDASDFNPVWFDLARIQTPLQGFRGFSEGMVNFKSGDEVTVNDDGTVLVENYGVGMMIFPSGLGGFNNIQATIPAYSPLIFTIDMFSMIQSDHDNDGIPSILEDDDLDGLIFNDNTDMDALANYFDADDDNDDIDTIDEIELDADGNFVGFRDTDGDGTPDHLDNDN